MPIDLLTNSPHSFTHYWFGILHLFFIFPYTFTLFNRFLIHSNIGFPLFCCVIALHHFPTFFILHFHVFSVTRCHHSYNELTSFAFFVFVRHTTHCFLLLVCYTFCGWKHCPEEAHLKRWTKRWLKIKYNHQKSLFICLLHIFYHSGFLSILCLPWKQSLPCKFSRQGGGCPPASYTYA